MLQPGKLAPSDRIFVCCGWLAAPSLLSFCFSFFLNRFEATGRCLRCVQTLSSGATGLYNWALAPFVWLLLTWWNVHFWNCLTVGYNEEVFSRYSKRIFVFLYSNLKKPLELITYLNTSERKQAKDVKHSTPSRPPIVCFGGLTLSPLSSGHHGLPVLDPSAF